jgi:hypothetical protein
MHSKIYKFRKNQNNLYFIMEGALCGRLGSDLASSGFCTAHLLLTTVHWSGGEPEILDPAAPTSPALAVARSRRNGSTTLSQTIQNSSRSRSGCSRAKKGPRCVARKRKEHYAHTPQCVPAMQCFYQHEYSSSYVDSCRKHRSLSNLANHLTFRAI